MFQRLYVFFNRALWRIAFVLSLTLFAMNLFFHTTVSYDTHEKVTISGYLLPALGMLILIAGILFWAARRRETLEKIHQGWLFAFFTAIYAAVSAYIIAHSNHVLCADAMWIYETALDWKAGNDLAFLPGGYIHSFPHQLGFLCYDILLTSIAETPVTLFCANAVLVPLSNWICWKISRELFKDRLVHLLTLIFSFSFVPQLFFIMFAYGLLPGWFFLQAAFYHTLRFRRTGSWKNMLSLLVFLTAAITLKSNNLIGGIAIILFLLLRQLRSPVKRGLICVLAAALCMVVPGRLMQNAFEARTHSRLDEGTPSILWVAMGTNIDNRTCGPGWYDGTTYLSFASGMSRAEASAEGRRILAENIEKIRQEPENAVLFLRDKLLSTWCDPLYQSLWSGPKPAWGQTTNTPLLLSLYGDGKAEDLTEHCAKLFSLTMWLGVCAFLWTNKATGHGWQMMFAFLIGGFLFHLVWETKSQYVYPYAFGLLPFAASGITQLIHFLAKHVQKTPI